jgi:dTDP-4-amino-4,6-dideoxygalactose transaminase
MPGPGAYWFGEEETNAVMKVIKSGYLFRYGNENDPKFLHKVSTLETEFAKYSGTDYALATSSGTWSLTINSALFFQKNPHSTSNNL